MLRTTIPVVLLLAGLCVPAIAQHNSGDRAAWNLNALTGSTYHPSPVNYSGMSLDKFLEKYPTLGDEIKTLTGATAANACDGFKTVGNHSSRVGAEPDHDLRRSQGGAGQHADDRNRSSGALGGHRRLVWTGSPRFF